MNYSFLLDNQNKRRDYPVWMLICFGMFNFWQMGFIYFVGPSLNIDGRTPLPMDMDNVTILIVLAYVFAIVFMAVLPQYVIWACRITTAATLVSAIGLFLPLGEDALRLLIYAQVFGCCFIIGFESFIMINYFSEKSVITHLTVAYGVAVAMISMVQNDFTPIAFPQFRVLIVIAVVMLLVFFSRMPTGKEVLPRYVTKNDGIMKPKKLLFGIYTLVFVSALMGVSGPAIAGEIQHGVFIAYAVDALVSLGVYLLYKKANIHPFRLFSICMGLGCVGYLLMFAAEYVPMLGYASAVLIGFGIFSCQMIPLYGMVLMKTYPSKYIPSTIISLALVAVVVQSSMVEVFRSAPLLLYLTYTIIMVMLDTGIRTSELLSLQEEHYCREENSILIEKNTAKTRRQRVVYLSRSTASALNSFLKIKPREWEPWLFPNYEGMQLTVTHLDKAFAKYSEKSGVKITPYQLRHSFATLFLTEGGDLFSLQRLMGHSDLRMTKRYTELDEDFIRKQHRECSPANLLAEAKTKRMTRI